MPGINKMFDNMNEQEANELIECLNNAQDKVPDIMIDSYVDALKHHVSYTLKMLKTVEENRLWNIVLSDLEYYKEKEKIKMQRSTQA